MNENHEIIRQVIAARENIQEADALIRTYMPFIKAETAKFLHRPPLEGHDDELSVAMIAFHEAIGGYSAARGSFLKYASMLIKSRLIDYYRRESRHGSMISLDAPLGEDEGSLADTLSSHEDFGNDMVMQDATRKEIQELGNQMKTFAVSFMDVADNCPKQQRTLDACKKALQYARDNPELLDEFLRTKRLPVAKLCEGSGVERKTLERHRKYMAALLLIYTNGYEIIRGHLKQVMKGGL